MSDAFLPGNGFDTYETQDKVLVSMDGTVDCGVVVRILQQQGFGVAGAVVQLAADQSAWAAAARQAAEALGIECIVLKAEALANQPAEVLGSGNDARFAALLTAADKLGIQYIATGTTPGWSWAATACTPSVPLWTPHWTRVPHWRRCRRTPLPVCCCPWASLPPPMCRRWHRILR